MALKCQEIMVTLKNKGATPHIHWVPGHEDIQGNEIADKAAKTESKYSNLTYSECFTSFSYVKHKIKAKAMEN